MINGINGINKRLTAVIQQMRPMERHRYITRNTKTCPACKSTKRLSTFWDKEENSIHATCRSCETKAYGPEITQIVLSVLKNSGIDGSDL